MRPRSAAGLAAAVASLSLLACASPVKGTKEGGRDAGKASAPTLVQATAFDICPWPMGQAGLQVVSSPLAWERFLAQGKPSPGAVGQWAPRFDAQWVVVYGAGFKPSSGHALRMGVPVWADGGRTLQLPVTQVSPPAGTLQATVMTSPCAVAWLQAPAAKTLRVVDAHSGAVLGEAVLTR